MEGLKLECNCRHSADGYGRVWHTRRVLGRSRTIDILRLWMVGRYALVHSSFPFLVTRNSCFALIEPITYLSGLSTVICRYLWYVKDAITLLRALIMFGLIVSSIPLFYSGPGYLQLVVDSNRVKPLQNQTLSQYASDRRETR
jgi:hypothetical protein